MTAPLCAITIPILSHFGPLPHSDRSEEPETRWPTYFSITGISNLPFPQVDGKRMYYQVRMLLKALTTGTGGTIYGI